MAAKVIGLRGKVAAVVFLNWHDQIDYLLSICLYPHRLVLPLALVKQNKIKTVTTETHSLQKHCDVLSPKWDICTTPWKAQGTVSESRKEVGDIVGATCSSNFQTQNTGCSWTHSSCEYFCYEGGRGSWGPSPPWALVGGYCSRGGMSLTSVGKHLVNCPSSCK